VLAFFPTHAINGASIPHYDPDWGAMLMEVLLTFVLVFTILTVGTRGSLVGANAALAVGATVVYLTIWAGRSTGASMNPARSLGSALVLGRLRQVWVYIAGPFIGATLAVISTYILSPHRQQSEKLVAKGVGGAEEK